MVNIRKLNVIGNIPSKASDMILGLQRQKFHTIESYHEDVMPKLTSGDVVKIDGQEALIISCNIERLGIDIWKRIETAEMWYGDKSFYRIY